MRIVSIDKNVLLTILLPVLFVFFVGCDQEGVDEEKPRIDISMSGAFPLNCDTLYFGETFVMRLLLSDNERLGDVNALSVDIHNNFNHHSHSTEVTECSLSDIKTPVNPFTLINDYDIPSGLSQYETEIPIAIPAGDGNGDYDEGDYHFFIRVTDHQGWSAQKGLSVKLLRRHH